MDDDFIGARFKSLVYFGLVRLPCVLTRKCSESGAEEQAAGRGVDALWAGA